MNAPVALASLQAARIEFTLDGKRVGATVGETILSVAKREGIEIPQLCFRQGYRPDGNCRACVVEVAGERTLAPSCCRAALPDMVVTTGSDRAKKSQRMVLEMLLADLPETGHKWVDAEGALPHGELSEWAAR
jgi:formate dehydrogenase major subunit